MIVIYCKISEAPSRQIDTLSNEVINIMVSSVDLEIVVTKTSINMIRYIFIKYSICFITDCVLHY